MSSATTRTRTGRGRIHHRTMLGEESLTAALMAWRRASRGGCRSRKTFPERAANSIRFSHEQGKANPDDGRTFP